MADLVVHVDVCVYDGGHFVSSVRVTADRAAVSHVKRGDKALAEAIPDERIACHCRQLRNTFLCLPVDVLVVCELAANGEIARLEYFIPKLCNVEMINNHNRCKRNNHTRYD